MDKSYLYNLFNKNIFSDYFLKDVVYKGYPLHMPRAIEIWEMLLNSLLASIREEFGKVQIVTDLPQTIPTRYLSIFYNDRFNRIEERIPNFTNKQGDKISIMTDALPYLFSKLEEGDVFFSTYNVVRPRNIGVKPLLRDEFIRYFQFVISSNNNSLAQNIEKLEKAIRRFFYNVRISTITVDRHSDSYYLKKSCLHATWINGNIESVLQCGILKKQYELKSGETKSVIDVGGAQRLLATFIYNNSDIHGLFLPHHLRDYDIIIRSEHMNDALLRFCKYVCNMGCKLKYIPENVPLKRIKRIAISASAIAIVVKRTIANHEFLTIYNRDMTVTNLYSNIDIENWFSKKYNAIEMFPYVQQTSHIMSRVYQNELYLRKTKKCYTINSNGLFN